MMLMTYQNGFDAIRKGSRGNSETRARASARVLNIGAQSVGSVAVSTPGEGALGRLGFRG